MMFVGDYGKASTRWLTGVLRRLVEVPVVVLDLTEAQISNSGVIDELMWLHHRRMGCSLPRGRIVMTEQQAGQPEFERLQRTFDVVPELSAAVGSDAGAVALEYACEPGPAGSDRPTKIITLDAAEWDIESSGTLASILAPAAEHRDVVVDLSAVSYIDSTCLGKFVGMRLKRSANGFDPGRLVIASPRVRRLFAIVKFDEIWPIYGTLGEAMRHGS